MSGNGIASYCIYYKLQKIIGKWRSTDIVNYNNEKNPRKMCDKQEFSVLNCVDSVKNYGKESDILLIISPPPGEYYGDYFACKDFIEQTKPEQVKYIIFIGELGRGDGSLGMFKYLKKNIFLDLKLEEEICRFRNRFGTVIKKVYIFEVDKHKFFTQEYNKIPIDGRFHKYNKKRSHKSKKRRSHKSKKRRSKKRSLKIKKTKK